MAENRSPADLFLKTVGVICVAVLLFVFYRYGWTGQRKFASWPVGLMSYAMPAALAALCFYSVRLSQARRVLLASGLIVSLAGAFGTELMLRIFQGIDNEGMAAKLAQHSASFDTREPGEVIADFRNQGIEAVSQIIVPPLENDRDFHSSLVPLAGMVNTRVVACNQNGQYLTYESDDYGFHNPSRVWQSNSLEIVAVGNSYTLGYCVPSDKNFVAVIRERYPATVNLGMVGEGPLHILGVLKEYAEFLKPKRVLWFYAEGSSLSELRTEKESAILLGYLRNDFTQGLRERPSDVRNAVRLHLERQAIAEEATLTKAETSRSAGRYLREFSKLSVLRERLGILSSEGTQTREAMGESSVFQPELKLLPEILSLAKAQVSDWGGLLYFVYIPAPGRYFGDPGPGAAAREEVLRLVNSLNIPIVDTYPVFQNHDDPLSLFPLRRRGHINEEGHRLVAETVLNSISSIN